MINRLRYGYRNGTCTIDSQIGRSMARKMYTCNRYIQGVPSKKDNC